MSCWDPKTKKWSTPRPPKLPKREREKAKQLQGRSDRPRDKELLTRLQCAVRHLSDAIEYHKTEGSTWRVEQQLSDAQEDIAKAKRIVKRLARKEVI